MAENKVSSDKAIKWYMEHMEVLTGWRLVIFLPFNGIWQVMQSLSIVYTYTYVTSLAAYELDFAVHVIVGLACDLFYVADIICSFLHRFMKDERKFKSFQPWPWYLVALDIFTVIPFHAIYKMAFISNIGPESHIWRLLHLTSVARVYRIYYYFHQSSLWIQSVPVAYTCSYLILFTYAFFLTHAASCILQVLKTDEDLERCPSTSFTCFLVHEMNVFCLMAHRAIGNSTEYDTIPKKIAVTLFLTIGYFYIYSVLLPLFTFTCLKRSRSFFDFWNRYQRLKVFLSNLIEDKDLKWRTLNKFRTIWTYGRGDDEPEILRTFPLNLRKSVYTDLYWDSMRHSDLLQGLSTACKRSLAMSITGDFYLPGEVFWSINEVKNSLLYIASGILQVMADENSRSPILSFSGGTVLGESTLFHSTRSKTVLRVATFSEIHVLRSRDFFAVIQFYPDDKRKVWEIQKLRIAIAKMTQIRKNKMKSMVFNEGVTDIVDVTDAEDDCVKWMKSRFRDFNEMQSLPVQVADDAIKKDVEARKSAFSHTSVYLPLLNLGEDFEFLPDLMCIKNSLPWVMDPNSHFIRSWAKLIALFSLISCCLYPVFVAWWPKTPQPIIFLSHFTTFFFFVDILVQMFTAVKTKRGLIVDSSAILLYRLKSLAFFADIIAAVPLHIVLIQLDESVVNNALTRISILIVLFKAYRVVIVLNEWVTILIGGVSFRVMVKYLFLNCTLLYWSTALLQMVDVECMFGPCVNGTWYNPEKEATNPQYRTYASVFFTIAYLMDIPTLELYSHNYPSVLLISFTLALMLYLTSAWIGEYASAYMLEGTQLVTYRNLLQSVKMFMAERVAVNRIKRRVLDNMYFQWYYDSGDYLSQERSMLEDMPLNLKMEIRKLTIFQLIKSCEAFEEENEDLIWYLCRKGQRIPLPADSIVLNYGVQTMVLYVVYKGYVQLNSFIPKDARSGVAPAFYRGPGTIFPIVIAMSQTPSCIVARTLTDCELIVIQLEDLVRGLMLYSTFKDYVDAVKELDTKPILQSQLTLSYVGRPRVTRSMSYWEPFAEYGVVGCILWLILLRTYILPNGKPLIVWETFRLLTITISTLFWPTILLASNQLRMVIVYSLITLESLTWIDIYIRMHVAFYDRNGILITHPLRTCLHYFSTTCLLDLLGTVPFFHSVLFYTNDPDFNMEHGVIVIHTLFWLLSFHRFFLYMFHRAHIGTVIRYRRTLGIALLGLLIVHSVVEVRMSLEIEFVQMPDGTASYRLTKDSWIRRTGIPNIDTLMEIYFVILYCLTMTILRTYPFEKTYTINVLGTELACVVFGFVIVIHLNAYMGSKRSGSKITFALYRYHMKNLVRFLQREQADDDISHLAIKHFEHEWEKTLGQDLQNLFDRFPHNLEEDVMYSIYRKSLLGVPCFVKANVEFHRTLSREFVESHHPKGEVITFDKAVQNQIYLVHQGTCYVREKDVILHRGSLFGDLRQTGTMINTIAARTNVLLLSIPSPKYFLILNNYYNTENAYIDAITDVEDYIESLFTFPIPEEDQPIRMKGEVAEFEASDKIDIEKHVVQSVKMKKRIFIREKIYPKTWLYTILTVIFGLDAALTIVTVPIIIALRLASTVSFITIYTLDGIWVLKILASLRMAYVQPDTGNIISSQKLIIKRYMTMLDGFFVDVLTVLPIELFHKIISYYCDKWSDTFWKYFFLLRLLRVLHLWFMSSRAIHKLSVSDWTRWTVVLLRHFYSFNFLVALNILLATDERMKLDEYQTEFTKQCGETLLWGYLTTLNLYSGAGLLLINPSNKSHLAYNMVVAVVSTIEKIELTSEVLAIVIGTLNMKLEKLLKLKSLDKYITVRDVSPALRKRVLSYGHYLTQQYHTDVTPCFLKTAPYYIRVQVMQDLYLRHLLKCPIFARLPDSFLKQLSARLKSQLYLSNDFIVKEGDVDGMMFFVHEGEVCSLANNPLFKGLEYEARRYQVGEHFALEQGLSTTVPHSETFRAVTEVNLLSLKFEDWDDMRRVFPSQWAMIQKAMQDEIRGKVKVEDVHLVLN